MKPENQINAGLILLLHSLLIAIGMVVAYVIPSAGAQPASIGLSFNNLRTQHHSDEELQSWLSFLELPHQEMLVSKETLAEVLKQNKSLAELEFFHNIAASDRTEYLAQRISAIENNDLPYSWDLDVRGASHEEANTLLAALKLTHQKNLQKIGAASEPPIKVDDLSIDEATQMQCGEACSPAAGAFLAAILVIAIWSICASNDRKLPFSTSLSQLLLASSMLALVGSGIGCLVGANANKEYESELTVQVRANPFSFQGERSQEARFLTNELSKKIEVKNFLIHSIRKSLISELVTEKGMANWRSFKIAALEPYNLDNVESEVDHELLCDYILDRLEIEQDVQAPEIYTLRFRCADRDDSAGLLTALISYLSDRLDALSEETEFGSQLAIRFQVERLSDPEPRKVSLSEIASRTAFEGALFGAMFCLVTLSSTRVLAGSPPV